MLLKDDNGNVMVFVFSQCIIQQRKAILLLPTPHSWRADRKKRGKTRAVTRAYLPRGLSYAPAWFRALAVPPFFAVQRLVPYLVAHTVQRLLPPLILGRKLLF